MAPTLRKHAVSYVVNYKQINNQSLYMYSKNFWMFPKQYYLY